MCDACVAKIRELVERVPDSQFPWLLVAVLTDPRVVSVSREDKAELKRKLN